MLKDGSRSAISFGLLVLSACGGGGGGGGYQAPVYSISSNPTSVAFASETVGTVASATQNITLTNSGTAMVTVTAATVSGTNSTAFSQTDTCTAPLAVGASCKVTITFTPSVIGANAGSLGIATTAR